MPRTLLLKLALLALLLAPAHGLAEAPGASAPEAHSLLSAFMSYVDLRMRGVRQSLEVVAASAEARSGRWENMEALLSACQNSDGGLIVWFVRPDGRYYTPGKGLMNVRLNDRAYFRPLMSGEAIMGSLVVSKATGRRSAIIAVPMKKGGKVIGAVGASLFLDRLAEQVDAALALPPGATFFALAPDGLTTLNRKAERHFLDPRDMGSESLKRASNEILAHPAGETGYVFDNVTKHAIYRTSALTRWKFVIAFSPPVR